MLVTVRLFARLRELAGASELRRELPEGSSAQAAWDSLVRDHAELAEYEQGHLVRGQCRVRPADGAAEERG